MNLMMLGAQGTGKGTVAGIITEKTGWPQISTGDIFRKNISEKTELGIEADKYISKGDLVPDEITVSMIEERLNQEDTIQGFILDGFPRTIAQADKLEEILKKQNRKLDLVINLVAPQKELIERMITRRVCTNQSCKATYNIKTYPPRKEGICDKCGSELKQRADDMDPKAIEKRLEIYKEKTIPLVEYYKNKGILRIEDVSKEAGRMGEDVASDILKDIGQ